MTTAIKGSLAITLVAAATLFLLGLFGILPSSFLNGGWIKFVVAVVTLFVCAFALLYLTGNRKSDDESVNPPL